MTISDDQLAGFVSKKSLVAIRRDRIDSNTLQAIPLRFSNHLLLVQYIYDFRLDGQLIIRRADITSMTSRATDRFQRRLLCDHGLIDQVDFEFRAELSSFPALLNSQPASPIVILENEGLTDSEFWIGEYIDSSDNIIMLREFSGAAKWNDQPTEIPTTDVTCCQLNSNYINFYAQYFDENPSARTA